MKVKKINTLKKNNNVKESKILPYSLEAEQSVLGGLMIDNDQWNSIIEYVVTSDFFILSHQTIFNEMQFLLNVEQPIDLITLSESLEKKGKLDSVGGFAYLAELSKNTPSIANISAYANIVRERSLVRQIISVANDIAHLGYSSQGYYGENLLNIAEQKISKIAEERKIKNLGLKSIDKILENTIIQIESMCKNAHNGITGIDTGYKDLNKKTAGFQPSDLIIIAARPSMGKTTFAMNLCENIAMMQKKPVLIFSLEMPAEQIAMRMLSSLSRVDQTRIRTGQLNDEEWSRISSTMKILVEKKNIYIDDSSRLTPAEVRYRSKSIFREYGGLSIVMIDYLQLMRIPSFSDNRILEIAEISRALKSLAKELHIPIVALSQLNRSLEQRSDKRPVNSDLRESGSIEQDADLIMFIYRDEIYNENSDMKGVAEIIIGKHRNGPIGSICLTFNAQWSRFDNYININSDSR